VYPNSSRGTAPTFSGPQSLYFYLLGHPKPLLYSAKIENKETLHRRIVYVCQAIRSRPETFKNVRLFMIRHVLVCTDLGGGLFSICCEL